MPGLVRKLALCLWTLQMFRAACAHTQPDEVFELGSTESLGTARSQRQIQSLIACLCTCREVGAMVIINDHLVYAWDCAVGVCCAFAAAHTQP